MTLNKFSRVGVLGASFVGHLMGVAHADTSSDRATVAKLDTTYQAAVKINDTATMDRILDPGFVLVIGNGTVVSRDELLAEARKRSVSYEHQEEDVGTQTVRVWGDTAVVTARLWLSGTQGGAPFNRRLWFSDTYVRTPAGWRYVFGQASLSLPPGER
jgi:ketosteroid isomerase-like protein